MPKQPMQNFKKAAHKLKAVKPIHLFIIAVASSAICLYSLRTNNEHMVVLRNEVYSADKNDTNVTGALQNLQAYVTTHMNTDLSTGNGSVYPPIQLKYTYQRLLTAESNAVTGNTQLYTEAENYCQAKIPIGFSGGYRVPCIEQYIKSHPTSLPAIPESLYEFDFASPSWSPDLAGWSLLVSIISWLLLVASLLWTKFLKSLFA